MEKSFIEQRLYKLTQMDAQEFVRKLPNESVDLIHTDVPWGVENFQNKYFDDSPETLNVNIDRWMNEMTQIRKTNRR